MPVQNQGNPVDKNPKSKRLKIKDVYIGVFFDGTNNNMVNLAYYESFKKENGKFVKQKPHSEKSSELQNKSYEDINSNITNLNSIDTRLNDKAKELYIEERKLDNLRWKINLLAIMLKNRETDLVENQNKLQSIEEKVNEYEELSKTYFPKSKSGEFFWNDYGRILSRKNKLERIVKGKKKKLDELLQKDSKLKNERENIEKNIFSLKQEQENWRKERNVILEKLEKAQAEIHLDTSAMEADTAKGYSNVAILHSILKKQASTDSTLYYNVYIEGSGAENLAEKETNIIQQKLDSFGGLGFGVGIKGVASLVAKACKWIRNYLKPYTEHLDKDTKYHFYIFGFSRGSTCGRLFAQLTLREEGSSLACEEEMVRYYPYAKNSRVNFMESDFLSENSELGVITRENVFVDFLGIYDTVSSIGILIQKDGYKNSIANILEKDYSNIPKEIIHTGVKKIQVGAEIIHGVVKLTDNDVNKRHKMLENVGWAMNKSANILENDLNTKEWVERLHYKNSAEYGLFINDNMERIKDVFHIGAADEYRENFAFVNIGNCSVGTEIIIPGCHADVGGGYVNFDGQKERVLYRFIPRSVQNARLKLNVPKKESSKIGFLNPIKKDEYVPLNLDGLDVAGWVDKNWKNDVKKYYLDSACQHPCTLRYADALDINKFRLSVQKPYTLPYADALDSNTRVKFQHSVLGGYSNIPLRMMLNRFNKNRFNKESKFDLFDSTILEGLYRIPTDLEDFGNHLIGLAESMEKKRMWVTYGHDYFCEAYRRLRLKYLHFTASNQILDFKLNTEIYEIDWANFGNECNYNLDGKICRIMYHGQSNAPNNHMEGVDYLTGDGYSVEGFLPTSTLTLYQKPQPQPYIFPSDIRPSVSWSDVDDMFHMI